MKFQYIFLTFFGVMAVVAVLVFSKAPQEKNNNTPQNVRGTVTIWGTYPEGEMNKVIKGTSDKYKDSLTIIYAFHDPKDFDHDIVEALASGRGPDVLLLPDDLVLRHTDKIELIPYSPEGINPAWLQNTFIQAAEIYTRDQGLIAVPFAVDPMVMYWNRDIFSNASITEPPKYWDEFLTLSPKLTKRDPKTLNITQSTIAFGEYQNVEHAKDVLAMLFLQVGNPIVKIASDGKPYANLMSGDSKHLVSSEDVVSAFRFYMDFSNPLKNIYTWNRSRSNSLNEFINGNLAVHFDYASTYKRIREKNPHLNFAVAQTPLPRGTSAEITFAKVYGLTVLKSSKNKTAAVFVLQELLGSTPSGEFAKAFTLPPVRRDLLSQRPTDAVQTVFYDAAIRSRTWLDPKPELSNIAFQDMVESVSSGRAPIDRAIGGLHVQLSSALLGY